MSTPTDARTLLRHIVATLAYRAAKTLRDAPPGFGDFTNGSTIRTPCQILAHMGDLIAWGLRMIEGDKAWRAEGTADWEREARRFFDCLAALDEAIAERDPDSYRADKLIHGPLSDALTHVGQLAMLRGAAGAPLRPESYARAEIEVGRVGLEQSAPRYEFEGDA
ncbi:MAG TPA: hypothetical protein VMM35_12500, partial [Longimicrobiales bacterium]|nr:hypothetical protein [Longimicrobiales bacterium]